MKGKKNCLGVHPSEDTRKKMSESQKRAGNKPPIRFGPHDEETKRKIGQANRGKKASEDTLRKMSESRKGRTPWNKGKSGHLSDETRRKISEAGKGRPSPRKGKKHTEETRRLLSKIRTGKPSPKKGKILNLSDEARRKLSESSRGRKITEETRKKMSIASTGRRHTETSKEKIRKKRLLQVLPTKDTSIERAIQALLSSYNIPFRTHVPLLGQPDLFIEPNICIFCDGDYWHNRPDRVISDKNVTNRLTNDGYVVLRFWEREIKSDIHGCGRRIKEAINGQ